MKFDTLEFPHKKYRVHCAICTYAYITQLYIMSRQPVNKAVELINSTPVLGENKRVKKAVNPYLIKNSKMRLIHYLRVRYKLRLNSWNTKYSQNVTCVCSNILSFKHILLECPITTVISEKCLQQCNRSCQYVITNIVKSIVHSPVGKLV